MQYMYIYTHVQCTLILFIRYVYLVVVLPLSLLERRLRLAQLPLHLPVHNNRRGNTHNTSGTRQGTV